MNGSTLLATALPIVERRSRRAGLSAADTEDLLQDVVLKYLGAFPDTPPDNAAAWVERTTERAVIDRLRGHHRRPQDALPEHGDPQVVSTLVAAWREATSTSLGALKQRVVDDAMSLLSPPEREVFERRYLSGESSADVATDLGLGVNTVDQRASRARRRLQRELAARPWLLTELARQHPRPY